MEATPLVCVCKKFSAAYHTLVNSSDLGAMQLLTEEAKHRGKKSKFFLLAQRTIYTYDIPQEEEWSLHSIL